MRNENNFLIAFVLNRLNIDNGENDRFLRSFKIMETKTKQFVEAKIDVIELDSTEVITSSGDQPGTEQDVVVPDSGTWTPHI